MANVKISQLPAGTAASGSIVPATNAAGTATEKVTLGSIAALATSASQLTSGTLADARLSGNVVLTNDARLTNARTPTAHTHAISDVTSLQAALDGKVGSNTSQAGGGTQINNIVALTQAQYDAIPTKDNNTVYLVS
jgi:hypothetical protein